MLLVCLYLVATSRGFLKLLWFALAVCTLAVKLLLLHQQHHVNGCLVVAISNLSVTLLLW